MRRRKSFLMKIATMMVLFALVPTVFMLVFVLNYNVNTVKTGAQNKAQQFVDQQTKIMADLCRNVQNTAIILSADQTLSQGSKILRRGATIGQEIDCYRDLSSLIQLISINSEIDEVRFYLPDSDLVTHQRRSIFGLSDLTEEMLPPDMSRTNINSGWTLDENDTLMFYYRLVYTSNSNPVIALGIHGQRLRQMLEEAGVEEHVVIRSGDQILLEWGESDGEFHNVREADLWTIECTLSLEQFEGESMPAFLMTLSMLMCMLIATPFLAYFFSKPISRTIWDLANANQAMISQEYRQLEEDSSVKELLILQQSHNRMIDALQSMIRNVYEAQHKRDQAELTCLFEQVKPHFLYNTLEGGKWLAMQEGAMRTTVFMEKLAAFYRIGLSKGNVFVPLRQEIEHICQYVELMNLRYSDQITLRIKAEEKVLDQKVLKLLLQPLVENAIEHGLHGRGGEGVIEIEADCTQDAFTLCVTDNGSGMAQETYDRLNAGNGGGYGLDNVRRRLEVYYGEDARMHVLPGEERGVRVLLTLPMSI